jgi:hypothetical protein
MNINFNVSNEVINKVNKLVQYEINGGVSMTENVYSNGWFN